MRRLRSTPLPRRITRITCRLCPHRGTPGLAATGLQRRIAHGWRVTGARPIGITRRRATATRLAFAGMPTVTADKLSAKLRRGAGISLPRVDPLRCYTLSFDMPHSVTTRPATEQDDAFLFLLFQAVRLPELAQLPFPAAQLDSLMQMQYKGQKHSYAASYPEGDRIVLVDGQPAGRLWVYQSADWRHLVD